MIYGKTAYVTILSYTTTAGLVSLFVMQRFVENTSFVEWNEIWLLCNFFMFFLITRTNTQILA